MRNKHEALASIDPNYYFYGGPEEIPISRIFSLLLNE